MEQLNLPNLKKEAGSDFVNQIKQTETKLAAELKKIEEEAKQTTTTSASADTKAALKEISNPEAKIQISAYAPN